MESQIRVAVIDPDAGRADAAAAALTDAGYEVVVRAATGELAAAALTERVADVAMMDVEVAADGVPALPGQPALVVVAPPELAGRSAELVAAGVRGFVLRGDPAELVKAVAAVAAGSSLLSPQVTRPLLDEVARLYERERVRNQELQELVRQLQALSVTDWLTGLKNHGYFFERLNEELDRALRHRRPLSLLLADLDDFKQVNDARGHAAGDRVLQTVGEVMMDALRSADIVCRLGGEEFGVLLPETDGPGAFLVAERIREGMASRPIPGVGKVTISFGVASVPEHAIERDELVESADRALYLAKREGKNRTRLAGQIVALQSPPVARPLRGEIVELLVRVLRLRDPNLADHALRTAEVAVALGANLSLTAGELEHLRVASLLQDVGKIGVPDSILFKQGPLSEAQWQTIREHPKRGFDIVGHFVHPDAAEAVLANHERYDGVGYPRGLRGEEIPFLARVLLVADAYAAMTGERPFKAPLSSEEALDELRVHAGKQFDPQVVEAMAELAVALEIEITDDGRVVDFNQRRVAEG